MPAGLTALAYGVAREDGDFGLEVVLATGLF